MSAATVDALLCGDAQRSRRRPAHYPALSKASELEKGDDRPLRATE